MKGAAPRKITGDRRPMVADTNKDLNAQNMRCFVYENDNKDSKFRYENRVPYL